MVLNYVNTSCILKIRKLSQEIHGVAVNVVRALLGCRFYTAYLYM